MTANPLLQSVLMELTRAEGTLPSPRGSAWSLPVRVVLYLLRFTSIRFEPVGHLGEFLAVLLLGAAGELTRPAGCSETRHAVFWDTVSSTHSHCKSNNRTHVPITYKG